MDDSSSAPPLPTVRHPSAQGLAIAALVLGILALVLSFLLVGALCGVIGIVLGIIHLRQKNPPRPMAWCGIILSIVGIVAAVAFGGLYYYGYQQFQAAMGEEGASEDVGSWEGVIAPDIQVKTLDGQTLMLSELKGRRVVLDFWATWCPPCVKEIPHFVKLRSQVSTNELALIGISEEERSVLDPFIKKHRINYPIGKAPEAPAPYADVESIPTTFFIDRKGVIQKVLVGYHDYDALKEHATASDYEGEPKSAPTAPEETVQDIEEPIIPSVAWTVNVTDAGTLCTGDWDRDGQGEVMVLDGAKGLHVIRADGSTLTKVSMPGGTGRLIEVGHHKAAGPRVVAYRNWGHQVEVYDKNGKEIWDYRALMGANGAHWGDLDGDGTDELIVGMNGAGGLHAVSAEGKLLWKVSLGNVWNQAVISATAHRPARVLATEAGGSVRLYDAGGKPIKTLRPRGEYFSQMSAAVVDGNGTIQIALTHDGLTLGIDADSKEKWSTTGMADKSWRASSFASGDVDGDGNADWAFLGKKGELAVVNADGQRLGVLKLNGSVDAFGIISRARTNGLVVTLGSGKLQAHRFERKNGVTKE
jgi:cytochrome c biogenesis protein CcmG/thiol:disulfide interchange protein DsbE